MAILQGPLVGLVSGLAAALLFVALFGVTPLAIPLFVLTGVPLAIAGLGWGIGAAVVAAAAGAVVTGALEDWTFAAAFALLFAIPILWATVAAIEPRPAWRGGGWRSLGEILTHCAIAMAIVVVAGGVMVGYDPPTLTNTITAALVDLAANANPGPGAPPTAADLQPAVALSVALMPAILGVLGLIVIVVDLYLAGRSVRFSQGLKRPDENLWTVSLPLAVPAAFIGATALAFAPGTIGHAAEAVAGALGGAVALVGLAVIHALTRGLASRAAVLSTVYALLIPLSGLLIIIFALIGIAESVFHLRARRLRPRGPTLT